VKKNFNNFRLKSYDHICLWIIMSMNFFVKIPEYGFVCISSNLANGYQIVFWFGCQSTKKNKTVLYK